jgi:hypothetical protein
LVCSRELRLPAATPVISSCKFQFANARGPWVKCRIIVLDTAYHGQADSRVAVMCALEDKLLGATRDWACQMAPVALCKHSRRPGPHGAHPCCNLPRQSSAWICRWAESLMSTFSLFLRPARLRWHTVRSLKNGFSASPEQTHSRAPVVWRNFKCTCLEWVLLVRDERFGPQPSYFHHNQSRDLAIGRHVTFLRTDIP